MHLHWSSLTYRPSGVDAPLARGVPSLEICSTASTLLLRKSESVTSPTVCSFKTSSAVADWEVKRGLGVEDREGELGLDGSAMIKLRD